MTFETNEGDTPRIVVSAFGSSWANPQRGSIPVAWSVDPLLAERENSRHPFRHSVFLVNATVREMRYAPLAATACRERDDGAYACAWCAWLRLVGFLVD